MNDRSARAFEPTPPPTVELDDARADAADALGAATGCYLLRLDAIGPPGTPAGVHHDGTLRIASGDGTLAVSGDLYLHRGADGQGHPVEPDPAAGIPIFARQDYRFYVRGISLGPTAPGAATLKFVFELHAFEPDSGLWQDLGLRRTTLRPATGAGGQPVADAFEGEVRSASGELVGRLHAIRVSSHLRRAVVEIDRVPKMERPLDNGTGTKWQTVFAGVGWDLTVEKGDSNVVEPSGESWSDAELHQTMLKRRKSADLDKEWRYHVLCVRRLRSTDRGLMYDNGAIDSDDVPREGVGIATGWIPQEPLWGPLVGKRFGTATSSYFRTALHEVGHAMGLQHNIVDFGVMNTTDFLARRATNPAFPENALWSFAVNDRHRLRHLPDIWVRPGGIPFGQSFESAPTADEAGPPPKGLHLDVRALLEVVPLGAPVRVQYELSNRGRKPVDGPGSINVRDGAVRGRVIDPGGVTRAFLPLIRCIDADPSRPLEAGGSMSHAVTLLRGGDGALFPLPGVHRIVMEVTWRIDGRTVMASGETSVIVTGPETTEHAIAAHRMLSVPNAMLTLVLGGDHLRDGIDTIHRALDCAQLNEHVAWIEAKRLAVPFFERPARLDQAVELLDEATVMSQAEISRAADIVKAMTPEPRVGAVAGGPAGGGPAGRRAARGGLAPIGLADAADAIEATAADEATGAARDRLTAILQAKAARPSVADDVRTKVAAL